MTNKISTQKKSKLWNEFLRLSIHNTIIEKELEKQPTEIILKISQEEFATSETEHARNLVEALVVVEDQLERVADELGINEFECILN